jgi:hypothetical protein
MSAILRLEDSNLKQGSYWENSNEPLGSCRTWVATPRSKLMKKLLAVAIALALSSPAAAQLKPYQDYTVSDSVSNVATIKVKENMVEDYLEGIRNTWVASNAVAKKLGHLQDYAVYVSDLPQSGEFNVLLVTTFANTSDLAPNKARYEAFMRDWGTANEASTRTTTTTVYPNIRTITGEYLMRQVTFLPVKK